MPLAECGQKLSMARDSQGAADVQGVVLSVRRLSGRLAFAELYVGDPGGALSSATLVELVLKVSAEGSATAFADNLALASARKEVLRPGNVVKVAGSWCAPRDSLQTRRVDQISLLALVESWAEGRPGVLFRKPNLGETLAPDPTSPPGQRSRRGGREVAAPKSNNNPPSAPTRRLWLPCTPVLAPDSPCPRSWPLVLALAPTPRFSCWELAPHPNAASCSVHATVPGFEHVCKMEMARTLGLAKVEEKGGDRMKSQPGNVTCSLGSLDVNDAASALLSLKSVEHLYALLFVGDVPELVAAAKNDGVGGDKNVPQDDSDGSAKEANRALAAVRAAIGSVPQSTWRAVLRLWEACDCGTTVPQEEGRISQSTTAADEGEASPQRTRTFKVVKQRCGQHAFGSTQLAQHAAAAVQLALGHADTGWKGMLEAPDLTVSVKVHGSHLFVGVPLTRRGDVLWRQQAGGVGCEEDDGGGGGGSIVGGVGGGCGSDGVSTVKPLVLQRPLLLPKRLWVATPLRPPIAFGLVHCAASGATGEGLRCGDLLVDPCCGCGTVGEMAAQDSLSGKGSGRVFVLSGDEDSHAVACAAANVKRAVSAAAAAAAEDEKAAGRISGRSAGLGNRGGGGCGKRCVELPVLIDVVQWDATRLPLRSSVVDRLVTDLPFGKKCGSRRDNHTLYPRFFTECARVLRRGSRQQAGSRSSSSGGSSSSSSNGSSSSSSSNGISSGSSDSDARVVVLSADRGSLRRGVEMAAAASGAPVPSHNGAALVVPPLVVHAEHHLNMGGLNAVVLVLGHSQPPDGVSSGSAGSSGASRSGVSGGANGGSCDDEPSEKWKGGNSGRRRRGVLKRGM